MTEDSGVRRKEGTYLFLLLVIFLAAFLVLELFFRFGLYRGEDTTAKNLFVMDPRYGFVGIPNKSGEYGGFVPSYKDFVSYVKINGEGFNDDEFVTEKRENAYRIAMLGDSFTMAAEVNFTDGFHYLLERALNNESGKPAKYEVMNFGVGGSGTDTQYLLLEERVLKYKPDMVILNFFIGNDVQDNGRIGEPVLLPYFTLCKNDTGGCDSPILLNQPPVYKRPLFDEVLSKSKFLYAVYGKISYYYSAAMRVLKTKVTGEIPDYWRVYSANYNKEWKDAWELTKVLILETRKLSEENGAAFMLVVIPNDVEVYPEKWGRVLGAYPKLRLHDWNLNHPTEILEEFCSSNGIDCLFLLPEFQKYANETGRQLYYPKDRHMNPAGQRLTAELIYGKLIKGSFGSQN